MGQGTEVAFMGYDANAKLYTYDAFSSAGGHTSRPQAAWTAVPGPGWLTKTWVARR